MECSGQIHLLAALYPRGDPSTDCILWMDNQNQSGRRSEQISALTGNRTSIVRLLVMLSLNCTDSWSPNQWLACVRDVRAVLAGCRRGICPHPLPTASSISQCILMTWGFSSTWSRFECDICNHWALPWRILSVRQHLVQR